MHTSIMSGLYTQFPSMTAWTRRHFFQMEVLLQEGTWPDGFSPEERENLARLAPQCPREGAHVCHRQPGCCWLFDSLLD